MTGTWPAEVAHLPICPRRGLPVPYIAEIAPDGTGNFTILDDQRTTECLEHRLCAMCGRPMGEEAALLGDLVSLEPGGFFIEPPVHERCGEIATVDGPHDRGLCPFLSTAGVPRRPPEANVALVGTTPEELTSIGRTVPKRDWFMAIVKDYRPALTFSSNTGSPVMVYQAGRIIRVRRFAYGTDGRLAEVVRRPPPTLGPRRQPRRTTRAGRRQTGGTPS